MNVIIAAILAALISLGSGIPKAWSASSGGAAVPPVPAAVPGPTDSPAPMPYDVVIGAGPS